MPLILRRCRYMLLPRSDVFAADYLLARYCYAGVAAPRSRYYVTFFFFFFTE